MGVDTARRLDYSGPMTNNETLIANMTGLDIPAFHDELDDRLAQARDWSPVPTEWQGLFFDEVVEESNAIAERERVFWMCP